MRCSRLSAPNGVWAPGRRWASSIQTPTATSWSRTSRSSVQPRRAMLPPRFSRLASITPTLRRSCLVSRRRRWFFIAAKIRQCRSSLAGRSHRSSRMRAFVLLEGDHHLPYEGDVEPVLQAIEEFLGVDRTQPATAARVTPDAGEAPVVILFTDMESSTQLTQRLGDSRAQELVRAHNDIVREALRLNGGNEIKHTGDGIMASFASPSRALEGAVQIQRAIAEHNQQHPGEAVSVRIGLNAGEPVREQNDLFGHAVQLASRICNQAEPGQILASNVVRELVAGKGFLFADRGTADLRGFEDPDPPLRSPLARLEPPNSLPFSADLGLFSSCCSFIQAVSHVLTRPRSSTLELS